MFESVLGAMLQDTLQFINRLNKRSRVFVILMRSLFSKVLLFSQTLFNLTTSDVVSCV